MTLRKERILKVETGSTRSHCIGNSIRKRLWTCRKADCGMNWWMNVGPLTSYLAGNVLFATKYYVTREDIWNKKTYFNSFPGKVEIDCRSNFENPWVTYVWAGYLSRYSDWLRAGRSGIEYRWGRDFPPVQTGPGANPASCKMGTGSFPEVKCGQGVLLTTHPLLVPRSWKSRAIPLPTLWATPGL